MWKLGLSGVRQRLGSFAGALLALTLGVALVAVSGLLLDATARAPDGAQADGLASAMALLAVLATFSSAFVVASTFAYLVAQRQREFALLRLSGASRRQVTVTVLVEALVVGAMGSVLGCLVGVGAAIALAAAALRHGLVAAALPVRISVVALAVAAVLGIGLAIVGAYTAARRAGRARPIEALRTASHEPATMTTGRWIWGVLLLAGAGLTLRVPVSDATDGAARALLSSVLLIGVITAVSPVLVGPLLRVFGAFTAVGGAAGRLAYRSALGAVRRTTSTAGPAMITIALTGSVVSAAAISDAAAMRQLREQTRYEYVVLPAEGRSLTPAVVTALRGVAGVRVTAPLATTVVGMDPTIGEFTEPLTATGVDVAAADVLGLRVTAGSLDGLSGRGAMAVGRQTADALGWHVGDHTEIAMADGAIARVQVVAIIAELPHLAGTLLSQELVMAHEPRLLPEAAYLKLAPGAEPRSLAAAEQAAGGNARVQASGQWLAEQERTRDDNRRLALILLLGMPMLYTAISIVNTLVMATRTRSREFALIRLAGGSRRLVIRMVALEAVLTAAVAAALASGVTAVTVFTTASAVRIPPDMPWETHTSMIVACLGLMLAAGTIPAHRLLRRQPPIHIVAGHR